MKDRGLSGGGTGCATWYAAARITPPVPSIVGMPEVETMDFNETTTQNVVSMMDFQSDNGFSALSQVEAYWDALRGGDVMPKRSDVDPRGIERALEYAFIVERIAPGIARLRIAGSHLSDLMGMEVRGMPLSSMFVPACRRQIADLLTEVFERPASATLRLSGPGAVGKPARAAQMVLLPMKSDLGDVSRILGCVVALGEPGAVPCRFDMVQASVRALTSPDAGAGPVSFAEADDPAQETPPPSTGFAEPRAIFEPGGRRTLPPYLRLVKSDD